MPIFLHTNPVCRIRRIYSLQDLLDCLKSNTNRQKPETSINCSSILLPLGGASSYCVISLALALSATACPLS